MWLMRPKLPYGQRRENWSAHHQQQRTRTIPQAGPHWSGWSMARHLTHPTRPRWSGWRPARYLAYICAMHDHPGRAGTYRSIYKYISHVAGFRILSAAFLSVATLDTDSSSKPHHAGPCWASRRERVQNSISSTQSVTSILLRCFEVHGWYHWVRLKKLIKNQRRKKFVFFGHSPAPDVISVSYTHLTLPTKA